MGVVYRVYDMYDTRHSFIYLTVINRSIFHNRREIQEIPQMQEDALLLTALKEVMGVEISEKTHEDIDEPTIPP